MNRRKDIRVNCMVVRLSAAVAALCVLGTPCASVACTGVYAGRQATADGTILLGHTVDSSLWTKCHRVEVTPCVENAPGRTFASTRNKFRWNLPATTWKCVSTPRLSSFGDGGMNSACVNERGLSVSGTITGHANKAVIQADPYNTASGAGEKSLPILLALCCSSAREAVGLLGKVVAECGHFNGEIYLVADAEEAWYVEVYTGHQWAAVRMPEDKVACWGNEYMLTSFRMDSPDAMHSPGLLDVARKAGTLKDAKDGCVNLCAAYAAPHREDRHIRTWYGHRLLAPSSAGEFDLSRAYPLFYAPDRKVTLLDLMELMRSRNEGTKYCPEDSQDKTHRTIGTTKQSSAHVIEIAPALPTPLRCTIWAALANCEHSVFMPLNAAIDGVASMYEADQTGQPRRDWSIAGHAFRRLCALSETDRRLYGTAVRAFWHAREVAYLRDYHALQTSAAKEWETSPEKARKRLTEWLVSEQVRNFTDANRLFDELTWQIIENNRTKGETSPQWSPAPFKIL